MMTRRSSELLIIRLPAACIVAGTALMSILSARGPVRRAGLSFVGGARVRGVHIADQDALRQRARGTCRADLARFRKQGANGPEELPAALSIHAASERLALDRRADRLRITALSGYKVVALSAPEDKSA